MVFRVKALVGKIIVALCAMFVLFACKGRVESSEEDYYYYDDYEMIAKFMEQVESDTNSFYKDLEDEADELGISIIESAGKEIRVYSWISGGGTSPRWTNFTQYRGADGKVKSFYGLPLYGPDADCTVTDIFVAKNLKPNPIYLFVFYAKASSAYGMQVIQASEMVADTFAYGPNFKIDDEIVDHVLVEYTIPDWYFRTNGEGWDWMCNYYADEKLLYIPLVSDDYELTNRYSTYGFDGKNFVLKGEKGPRNIHPLLCEFQSLLGIYEMENHLLRVDFLSDERTRLAIWNDPSTAKQLHKPDLVLNNGVFNEFTSGWEFKLNNNVKYVLQLDAYGISLMLKNNQNIVSIERKRDVHHNFQRELEFYMKNMNDSLPACVAPLLVYVTEHYVVKVDSMANGDYRYASWSKEYFNGENLAPDLVLQGGVKEYNDRYVTCYVFRNGEYSYEVPTHDMEYFHVKRGKELLCKDRIIKVYDTRDIELIVDSW